MSGKLENMVSNLKTYLFAIGKNKILEHHRRTARHDYDIRAEILQMEEDDHELQQNRELQYRQISLALQQLGDPCKQILEMVYYHNRSMEFITEHLGYKNVDSTKNQKYKCMQRLKKLVQQVKV